MKRGSYCGVCFFSVIWGWWWKIHFRWHEPCKESKLGRVRSQIKDEGEVPHLTTLFFLDRCDWVLQYCYRMKPLTAVSCAWLCCKCVFISQWLVLQKIGCTRCGCASKKPWTVLPNRNRHHSQVLSSSHRRIPAEVLSIFSVFMKLPRWIMLYINYIVP